MRMPGRVSAAIEVLSDVMLRHRPTSEALRDWGKSHRFAGGGDRHAIGTLVYDALRHRSSAAHRMGSDTPRALVLATLSQHWNLGLDDIKSLSDGEHGPAQLSPDELAALTNQPTAAALHIAGDIPQWLAPSFTRVFGDAALFECQALSQRAPIDLRVNTLKATQEQLLESLQRLGAKAGPLSPLCVRIEAPGHDSRNINVEAEIAHGQGWFEVQDAASQIAALMSGVKPSETVLDLCAGAGGKTLALAALMQNQGKLFAHDRDRNRLRPIFERLMRAGVNNVEVVGADQFNSLQSKAPFDCVMLDAPCSGSGSWRRKPDAKWKFTAKQLEQRCKDQQDVLQSGASLVKVGGRLIYITCSVLAEENTDQVKWFLSNNKNFKIIPYAEQWKKVIGTAAPASADGSTETLVMSPRQHNTDGFFVAVMERQG
jgi:16S rRNA (cytosine967-C5)-methyltransferase